MTRIFASVMIHNEKYAVEIHSTFTTGDGRKYASVEALPVNGMTIHPFTEYSMGGPVDSSTARIQVIFLSDIRIAVDMPAMNKVEVGSL